jgi:hypothetical protein
VTAWFDPEQARGSPKRNAAPELLLRREDEVLLERIGSDRDLNPFAPGDDRERAIRGLLTHILCWSWDMCFLAANSSENDPGNMNLAS